MTHAKSRDADVAKPITSREKKYINGMRSRIRVGNAGALLRTAGIQILWIIVIVSGAGVSLNDALDGPDWVGPTLGFVVVVAAGVERVFGRTTAAAAAQDALRRRLAREQRLYLARAGGYAVDDAFERYTSRSEQLISEYDRIMVEYSSSLARPVEASSGGSATA